MGNLQSNPSSSTQTIEKKYEVFLNFRGVDTRYGFTNYLYEALFRKSIETFRDEEKIPKGDGIGPTLLKAIRESKISVAIFSKEYASSKWCLRELVEVMECREKNGQTVIPVFYKVTVDDVRYQEGSFKDGFDQLEKEFQENLEKEQVDSADVEKRKKESYEEMQKWRQALEVASRVKGWHVEGPESKVIDEIVKDISEKLMRAYKLSPCDFKGLFGFEKRFKQVMSLLSLDNIDTRIIGIWGMGGIGKTTIADAIFHQISKDDEYGKCFIGNVRQRLEQCGGLVNALQQEVLSKVLDGQDVKLDGVTLPEDIKRRLRQKKVFIVLDDVDDFLKLQELAAGLDGLGRGSRIIITTRRRDILKMCEVNDDYLYEVKGLSNQEAHQLFCQYAFGHSPPVEDLMALSHETLQAIDGNPLGLKVAGSSLLGLNKQEWQSALNRIKKSPEILNVLQISYNRLAPEHQNTFLDIACFFVGEHKDYVAKIVDNCPYSLKVLSNRSLITISKNKIIQMHDLLQEMGREIVCKEDLNNPGNRSRLWTQEDVLDTLKNSDGTNAIKGMFLDMSKMINEEHLSSQAFEKMKNLRFLKFYDSYNYAFYGSKIYSSKLRFPNGISYLSNKLRSLNWLGCPLKALPSNFIPDYLVVLKLRESNIEKLWEDEVVRAPKLKWIILTGCPYLIKVLDLLDAPLLEKIDIQSCESLFGLPSHNHFPSLTYLHLSSCNKLTRISDLLDAPLLEKVDIQKCTNLIGFPSPIHHFNNLRQLNMTDCKNLRSFPNNISFPSLVTLDLSWCLNIARISDLLDAPSLEIINLISCESLLDFPPIRHFNNLCELNMRDCKSLQNFPNKIPFPSLVSLDLSGCINLARISDFLDAPLLEKINLCNCKSLLDFPPPVHHFDNLRNLNLSGCKNLQSFPNNIPFPSLVSLDLSGCINLATIFDFLDAPLLEEINLCNCISLLDFPPPVHHFNNLRELNLSGCKNLQSFPNNISFPSLVSLDLSWCLSLARISDLLDAPLLQMINLEYCSSLLYFPVTFHHFNNLCMLNLRDCKNLRSFLSNNIHFPSLICLDFHGCIKFTKFPHISGNLKSLYMRKTAIDEVPPSIENLSKLVELDLAKCTRLKYISINIYKLKALRELNLSNCSTLECFPEILDIMGSLKIIDLSGTAIKGLHHSIENLSGLEILCLRECKNLDEVPSSTENLTKLVKLDLAKCICLKHISFNICKLKALRELDLSNCSALESFPKILDIMESLKILQLSGTTIKGLHHSIENLSGLEMLFLRECKDLDEVPSSIENLTKLVKLDLAECTRLKHISFNICKLKALRELDLSNCSALESFPEILDTMGSLKILHLSGTAIKRLHHSIENLSELRMLFLRKCKNLDEVPSSIENLTKLVKLNLAECTSLKHISFSTCKLKALKELDLSNCSALECFPEILDAMGSLKILNLSGTTIKGLHHSNENLSGLGMLFLRKCKKIIQLSGIAIKGLCDSIENLSGLEMLFLRECKNLDEVPSLIENLTKLVKLDLAECTGLKRISFNICKLKSLRKLDLSNCSALECFPKILDTMESLKILNLSGTTIKGLHHSIENLSGLDMLFLKECKNLAEVPSSIENLTKLVKLDLAECTSLKHISFSICKLKALSELSLRNCSALECFPEILDKMGSLKILRLSGTTIKGLHHSIENLSGLGILDLRECKNLEMLPISIYNLTSLYILDLSGCSKLENLFGNSVTDLSNCGESAITKPLICRLSNCNLYFTNCLNLNTTTVINIMELQINQHGNMTTKGCGTQAVNLKIFYPGSEVPSWFKRQTNNGSSINFQMSGDDGVNGHLIGLAACAVIEFDDEGYDLEGLTINIRYWHRQDHSHQINSIIVSYEHDILTDHVALWYFDASVLKLCESDCPNYLFEFLSESPMCRVKYCGVCPIYEKHNITLSSIANETCGAADQDFGETSVKEQDKLRKFSDETETSVRSSKDVIEPHSKRTCG